MQPENHSHHFYREKQIECICLFITLPRTDILPVPEGGTVPVHLKTQEHLNTQRHENKEFTLVIHLHHRYYRL